MTPAADGRAHGLGRSRCMCSAASRLERDGVAWNSAPKPPTRALDILRALAISKDHACALETLQDRLWPDARWRPGQGRLRAGAAPACASCSARPNSSCLREGKLQLAADKAWVDLDDWERRLKEILGAGEKAAEADMQSALAGFAGPRSFGRASQPGPLPLPIGCATAMSNCRSAPASAARRKTTGARARATYLQGARFLSRFRASARRADPAAVERRGYRRRGRRPPALSAHAEGRRRPRPFTGHRGASAAVPEGRATPRLIS